MHEGIIFRDAMTEDILFIHFTPGSSSLPWIYPTPLVALFERITLELFEGKRDYHKTGLG